MDTGWIIAIVILLIVVIGVGGSVTAYQISRRQRQSAMKRGEGYQGPPPLPPAPPQPPLEPKIRWGNLTEYDPVSPRLPDHNRIRWGHSSENIAPPPDIDLSNTDSWVKSPICKEILNVHQDNIHICPNCKTPFHRRCFDEFNRECPICKRAA